MTTSLYQMNFAALQKAHPTIAERIPEFSLDELSKKYTVEILPEGGVTLRQDNFVVDTTAKDFLPPYESPIHAVRALFVCGFGVGSLFNHLTQSLKGQVADIFVIEPSIERFQLALALQDWTALLSHPKIHWLIGENLENFDVLFYEYLSDQKNLKNARASSFVFHPVIQALHPDYFESIEKTWATALDLQFRSLGSFDDNIVGFRNTLMNRDWIQKTPGVNLLRGQFAGKPAVVISSGPSLTKSLTELKTLQDKAVLIAVDSAFKVLLEAGIEPHFVVSLERDESTTPFFENLPKNANRTALVTFPIVSPKLIDNYPGQTWVMYRDYPYHGFFETQWERGYTRCGPSVSHMGVKLASYLGCSELVLVGQDLSYDPKTLASHAAGIEIKGQDTPATKEELLERLKSQSEEFFLVAGNTEKAVPTSTSYYVFGLWMGEHLTAGGFKKTANSTAGGAKIPSVVWSPLTKATEGWKENPQVAAILENARTKFQADKDFDTFPVLDAIRIFHDELGKFKEVSKTILSTADSDQSQNSTWVERLRESQMEYLGDRAFQALVTHFMQAELLNLEWTWYGIKEGDAHRVDRSKLNLICNWAERSLETLRKVEAEFRSQMKIENPLTTQNEIRI